ncbi:MAG TPA: RNA polymerase sigma factor [Gemmatimonadales bacterium]|nr:RNA polymerase sigma factor [Gemmatimonadales bacterium]
MTARVSLPEVSPSDAELVQRVRQGNLDAYGLLMVRYRLRFGRYAFHLLGNESDAEDALQDAFFLAYRSIDQCREPARFGAWLFRILVNRCRTMAVQRGRDAARRVPFEAADIVGVAHPAESVVTREEIHRALGALVPEQREAFLLKYVEEMTYEEMVELTGAKESALKMRVKRACERLRRLLGEHRAS